MPLIGAFSSAGAASIPNDAHNVIQKVRASAEKNDFPALRRLMVRDFQWSFGGDADAEQALSEWKADPRYMRNLARVTAQSCRFLTREIIECPGKAGKGYRAGFARTSEGWRMRYFVAGD
jgi:hypothetical protein